MMSRMRNTVRKAAQKYEIRFQLSSINSWLKYRTTTKITTTNADMAVPASPNCSSTPEGLWSTFVRQSTCCIHCLETNLEPCRTLLSLLSLKQPIERRRHKIGPELNPSRSITQRRG